MQKLEGVPDEPVPEEVANELQPYVANLQKKDGYQGELRDHVSTHSLFPL